MEVYNKCPECGADVQLIVLDEWYLEEDGTPHTSTRETTVECMECYAEVHGEQRNVIIAKFLKG